MSNLVQHHVQADPTAPLPAAILTDIAEGLAAARPFWEPALDVADDRRGHVRLVASEMWEAWLITWPVGHGVDLHDHGGSAGVITVMAGELVEVAVDPGEGFTRTVVGTGGSHSIPPDRIHDVLNAGQDAAVSIHVYSPPLSSMTFYDEAGSQPLRTESIFPEEPAQTARAASRSLHPSSRTQTRG